MADVAGRILDRAGALYNVRHPDFAADATGVTDTTAAIQAALNAAAADGGGTVLIPPGTYLVGNPSSGGPAPLEVASNIRLVISRGATLKAALITWTDRGVIEVPHTSTNVTIEGGGTIDGQRSLNANARILGVSVRGARRVRIRNLFIKDMPANPGSPSNPGGNGGDGVIIGVGANFTSIPEDVRVESVTVDNVYRSAFSVIAGRNIRLVGCTALNTAGSNPGSGLDVEPDPGLGAYDVAVIGCHFAGNNLGLALSKDAHGVSVSGCTFAGNRVADFVTRGRGVTFVGNTLDVMARGVHVYSATVPAPTPEDPNRKVHEARGCRIIGNTFRGAHRSTERTGVLAWDVEDLLISGNEFRDINGTAIQLDQRTVSGAQLSSRGVTITHNQIWNCVPSEATFTGAIQLLSADPNNGHLITDVILTGNTIHDMRNPRSGTAPFRADYGIQATNLGAAERATWHVSDNIVTGPPVALSGLTQLGNVLVQAANVAFPSVPASSSATVDVAVDGVATSDAVLMTPLASLGARISVAFVRPSAAGTVRVQLFNHDSAAAAAQTVSCKFVVFKS
jgi:hypothetical protein